MIFNIKRRLFEVATSKQYGQFDHQSLVNPASLLLITATTLPGLLMYILVHLIIPSHSSSSSTMLSLIIRHASSSQVCINVIGYASSSSNIHHSAQESIITVWYACTSYCIRVHHHTMVCMYIIFYRSASTSQSVHHYHMHYHHKLDHIIA